MTTPGAFRFRSIVRIQPFGQEPDYLDCQTNCSGADMSEVQMNRVRFGGTRFRDVVLKNTSLSLVQRAQLFLTGK